MSGKYRMETRPPGFTSELCHLLPSDEAGRMQSRERRGRPRVLPVTWHRTQAVSPQVRRADVGGAGESKDARLQLALYVVPLGFLYNLPEFLH